MKALISLPTDFIAAPLAPKSDIAPKELIGRANFPSLLGGFQASGDSLAQRPPASMPLAMLEAKPDQRTPAQAPALEANFAASGNGFPRGGTALPTRLQDVGFIAEQLVGQSGEVRSRPEVERGAELAELRDTGQDVSVGDVAQVGFSQPARTLTESPSGLAPTFVAGTPAFVPSPGADQSKVVDHPNTVADARPAIQPERIDTVAQPLARPQAELPQPPIAPVRPDLNKDTPASHRQAREVAAQLTVNERVPVATAPARPIPTNPVQADANAESNPAPTRAPVPEQGSSQAPTATPSKVPTQAEPPQAVSAARLERASHRQPVSKAGPATEPKTAPTRATPEAKPQPVAETPRAPAADSAPAEVARTAEPPIAKPSETLVESTRTNADRPAPPSETKPQPQPERVATERRVDTIEKVVKAPTVIEPAAPDAAKAEKVQAPDARPTPVTPQLTAAALQAGRVSRVETPSGKAPPRSEVRIQSEASSLTAPSAQRAQAVPQPIAVTPTNLVTATETPLDPDTQRAATPAVPAPPSSNAPAGPPLAASLPELATQQSTSAPVQAAPLPTISQPGAPSPFTDPSSAFRLSPQLESTIDQLTQTRSEAQANRPELTLRHQEFGAVTMRLEAMGGDLRATLSARDPGFVPAIQTALAERSVAASSETTGSGAQRGSDQGSSQSGSQNQSHSHSQSGGFLGQGWNSGGTYGSSTGASQGTSQPYTGQTENRDEDSGSDRGRMMGLGEGSAGDGEIFA